MRRSFRGGGVLLLVLLTSRPAAGQLGDPYELEHPIAQANPFDDGGATIAAGPGGFLVVWTYRNEDFQYRMMATRLDAAGAVLDPYGIEIGSGNDSRPSVAWDGEQWLVVWVSSWVWGRRVSPTGELGPLLEVTPFGNYVVQQDLACGPTQCLVAWVDTDADSNESVRVGRIEAGVVLGDDLPTTTATTEQFAPSVAWDGTHYLVVWQDTRDDVGDIYGARITTAGDIHVDDGDGILIAAEADIQQMAEVVWNGAKHVVAWTDARNSPAYEIHATEVAPDGLVADPGGELFVGGPFAVAPRLSWNGSDHLLTWRASGGGWGLRLSATLAPEAAPISISTYDYTNVNAAAAGSGFLVSFAQPTHPAFPADIQVADVQGGTQAENTRWISGMASAELLPVTAGSDAGAFVVWTDSRDGPYQTYGTRIGPGGQVLDGSGLRLGPPMEDFYEPAVAFGGGVYLVVWQRREIDSTSSPVEAVRVDRASGEVLDDPPITIAPENYPQQASPSVAWNGTDFFVVWTSPAEVIVGKRVRASDGAILDGAEISISRSTGDARAPSIAWSGTTLLVAWQDYRATPGIYGARLTATGTPLDVADVLLGPPAQPRLAGSPEGFVLAYQVYANGDEEIHARRLEADANPIDATPLELGGSGDWIQPRVAWDGGAWMLTWAFYTETVTPPYLMTQHYYAVRLPQQGSYEWIGELASSPARFSNDSWQRAVPAPLGDGSTLLVWPVRVSWASTLAAYHKREDHLWARIFTAAPDDPDPDAGVADAGTGADAGAGVIDGGSGADGGTGEDSGTGGGAADAGVDGGSSGGCCRAAAGPGGTQGALAELLLCALVLTALARRGSSAAGRGCAGAARRRSRGAGRRPPARTAARRRPRRPASRRPGRRRRPPASGRRAPRPGWPGARRGRGARCGRSRPSRPRTAGRRGCRPG